MATPEMDAEIPVGQACALSKASERAWRAFNDRIAELNGIVLEPDWLGSLRPHRIRCAAGHETSIRPNNVQQGGGTCRACAGRDPLESERAFRTRVAELGGTVLEPIWLGSAQPHRVRCAAGHEGTPRPTHVQRGTGICRKCAGQDAEGAERAFRARVAALGGTVLEQAWLGSDRPHRVLCAAGHECTPRPGYVRKGGGICRACVGQDSIEVERAFRARVAELGGIVLEQAWLGSDRPHRVRCPVGHESTPRPSKVQQGGGICRTCAGRDPSESERAFRERVATLGGLVLEQTWLGVHRPHRVRCPVGHEVESFPSHAQQGNGICRVCAGKAWDAFYVVADDEEGRVKFGITSGDPRPRLGNHKRAGYSRVVRRLTGLPGNVALEMERAVRATLLLARKKPVQGREYFDAASMAVILDVVDNYPIHAAGSTSDGATEPSTAT